MRQLQMSEHAVKELIHLEISQQKEVITMTIGEIVRLRIMPEEAWEIIDQRGEQFCLMNLEEPRLSIWARESELLQEIYQ